MAESGKQMHRAASVPVMKPHHITFIILVKAIRECDLFEATTDDDGLGLYAQGSPSLLLQQPEPGYRSCIPSAVICGWHCSMMPGCANYNFRNRSGQCGLFRFRPWIYSTVSRKRYEIQRKCQKKLDRKSFMVFRIIIFF